MQGMQWELKGFAKMQVKNALTEEFGEDINGTKLKMLSIN